MNHVKNTLIVILVLATQSLFAQKEHGEYDRFSDRLFFGGTLGLTIGSRVTQIDIAPLGGIWVLPQWSVGVGGRYTYRKDRFDMANGSTEPQSTNIWGFSAFTQIMPIPDFYEAFNVNLHGGIILQGEYEGLYYDRHYFDATADEGKTWSNIYLVGGGWKQWIGRKAAVNFMVLWVITDNSYSPYYSNPILRFNVTF
ncbi:MAG: hypothetical protein H6537_01500 [Bacteroidales bacterium]|nr:hypothetical protein [Bacteroidales bacterium]HPD95190.1 hypothetical protein [Tenuifilaceae bacterium]HRX31975.1 hypothetical protein [Tenuifilaceae bacterium]